jgi:adenylate cyclase
MAPMLRALSPRSRKLLIAGAAGLVVGAVAGALAWLRPPAMERGELVTYDARMRRLAAREPASRQIVMVDVGDSDLRDAEENFGFSWPWRREVFGYLVQYLSREHPRAVVLDFVFEDKRVATEDPSAFADALRASGRAVFGVDMPSALPQGREGEVRNLFARRLARFALLSDAERAAFYLQVFGVRTGLVERDGRSELWAASGASDQDLEARLKEVLETGRLQAMGAEEGGRGKGVELAGDALPGELTVSGLVERRDALRLSAPEGLALPVRELVPPVAAFASGAARLGNVAQENDFDGVLRRHHPLVFHRGLAMPSLSLAALLVAEPGLSPRLQGRELVLGERRLPLDEHGALLLRFKDGPYVGGAPTERTRERGYTRVRAYDVLRSQAQLDEGASPVLSPSLFADKFVIVSATAGNLRDQRSSPVAKQTLGAELNAVALENLLDGTAIRRAPAWVDACFTFVLALLLALAVAGIWDAVRAPWAALGLSLGSVALALGGAYLGTAWALQARGVWVAAFAPSLGCVASALFALLSTNHAERGDRRFVQEALGRYTSGALVRELIAHPEYLSLDWGASREVSVYFSDIANFTSFSESLPPERLVLLLNHYLTAMTDIVLAHGGVVDKYIGDAIMAFWGAPLPRPDHATQAVLAAIGMRRQCEALRPLWLKEFNTLVIARAGINTGPAVAGNMGSRHKFNYTVMGDAVNLASRLEGANKPYGTTLMISEGCYAQAREAIAVRELDLLAVKGKQQPVRVYEVLEEKGRVEARVAETVRHFHEGLVAYRAQEFRRAIACFERALGVQPEDGPSLTYLERCKHFVDSPPGAGWDGVWRMKEK